MLTLRDRVDNYAKTFPDRPPMWATDRWIGGEWIGGNNYKGSGYYGCLGPEVRVLTSDLQWVRQGDVRPGDYLVGVTEHPAKGKKRRLETSLVLNVGPVDLPSRAVFTTDGHRILCSDTHLWLVLGRDGGARWVRADQLEVGSKIRKVCSHWGAPTAFDSGWVAGILDGEGHVEASSGLRVGITQNPGEVMDRVCGLLRRWGVDFTLAGRRGGSILDARTTHMAAALQLLGQAPSVRLRDRWAGVGLPIRDGGYTTVSRIQQEVGSRRLVGMETSTKTFIAEGLVSHNSYPPDYLERVWALFPDMIGQPTAHLFSGSLDASNYGVRVDVNPQPTPTVRPDVCADVRQLPFPDGVFKFLMADTPYGPVHAKRYNVKMPDRAAVTREAARVTQPGGFLVWLDTKWPMYRKDQWLWCGTILVIRSTNHDYRGAAIFQRLTSEPTGGIILP